MSKVTDTDTRPRKKSARTSASWKVKDELYALRKENAELRASIGLDQISHTMETWQAIGSQEIRDAFAARAFAAEWGHTPRALQRLGFLVYNAENGTWNPKVVAELSMLVFDTPGVQQLLTAGSQNINETWEKIMERQRRTAVLGDDINSAKAAALVAKVEGRLKPSNTSASPMVSLHVLVNNNKSPDEMKQVEVTETHDPLAILSHEPSDVGDPIADPLER